MESQTAGEDYPFFPLFVDLSGKKILVVGGGKIALRRIRTLVGFTERITVVAPRLHPDLLPLETAGKLDVQRRAYAPGDVDGAFLVLAATNDPAVNETVRLDCKRLGIPVNVSSDRQGNDFYFPGIARKGDYVAGVTASGRDHTGAKKLTEAIRELLEKLDL